MNASEWRAKGREAAATGALVLALPSGMKILARRPDPMQLALWGRLPLGLVAGESAQPSAEEAAEMAEYMRTVLIYACVEPRISMKPAGPMEIHPSEVPLEDALFIIRWALRAEGAAQLRSFRGERPGPVPVAGGVGVRDAAERDAGDPGPRDGAGI